HATYTLSLHDALPILQSSGYDILRETFQGIGGKDEEQWKKFLHDGFLKDSAAKAVNAEVNAGRLAGTLAPPAALSKDNLEVVFIDRKSTRLNSSHLGI